MSADRFDVRLAPAAGAAWLCSAVCVRLGPAAWVVALSCGVVAGFCALAIVRKWIWWMTGATGWVIVGALAVGSGFGAATALRNADRDGSVVSQFASGRETVTTTVIARTSGFARPLSGKTEHFDGSRAGVSGTVIQLDLGTDESKGVVSIRDSVFIVGPADEWLQVVPSTLVRFSARVVSNDRPGFTAAVLIASGSPQQVGAARPQFRLGAHIRETFATVAKRAERPDSAGLLAALVLGDESGISPQLRREFTDAGLSHLTAVSGANFALVAASVLALAALAGLSINARAAVTLLAIVAFAGVVGPTGSVLRAAVMGGLSLVAIVARRSREPWAALLAAVIVLLAAMPQLAVDYGFALSVIATAGLILFAPTWIRRLEERGLPRSVAAVFAVAFAAQVVTAPVVAAIAGSLPLAALPANILVAPVIVVITVVGTLAAVLAPVLPGVAEVLARLLQLPLWWLTEVAGTAADGPTVGVPTGFIGGLAVAGVLTAACTACWFVRVWWQHGGCERRWQFPIEGPPGGWRGRVARRARGVVGTRGADGSGPGHPDPGG